jgi:hypothetical protein
MLFWLDLKHNELNPQAFKICHSLTFGQQMKTTTKFWTNVFFGFGGFGSKPFQQQDLKLKDNP